MHGRCWKHCRGSINMSSGNWASMAMFLLIRAVAAQEIVVIDHVGPDHSRERQTTIKKLKTAPGGRVSYRIERKIFGKGHIHYSKSGGAMYIPPVQVQEVWLYPARYSYQKGIDQDQRNSSLVSFDESVEIDLSGYDVDELLGGAPDEEAAKEVALAPKKRTEASLGILAAGLEEQPVEDPGVAAKWSAFLADLGGQRGFLGQRVEKVISGGPAEVAGAMRDDLVVDVNGTRIDRDRKLNLVEDYLGLGKPARVTVVRRDRRGSVTVYTLNIVPGVRTREQPR